MVRDFPIINWIENDPIKYNCFVEGSVFLVATLVRNNKLGGIKYEYDCVEIRANGDGARLYYRNGDIYDAWNWEDFEFFTLIEGDMPYCELK